MLCRQCSDVTAQQGVDYFHLWRKHVTWSKHIKTIQNMVCSLWSSIPSEKCLWPYKSTPKVDVRPCRNCRISPPVLAINIGRLGFRNLDGLNSVSKFYFSTLFVWQQHATAPHKTAKKSHELNIATSNLI